MAGGLIADPGMPAETMQNPVVLADCRASTGRLLGGVCQPLEALNRSVLLAPCLRARRVLTPLWDAQVPLLALRDRRTAGSCRSVVPATPLPFSHTRELHGRPFIRVARVFETKGRPAGGPYLTAIYP